MAVVKDSDWNMWKLLRFSHTNAPVVKSFEAIHQCRSSWNFAREDTDPIAPLRPEGPWGPWSIPKLRTIEDMREASWWQAMMSDVDFFWLTQGYAWSTMSTEARNWEILHPPGSSCNLWESVSSIDPTRKMRRFFCNWQLLAQTPACWGSRFWNFTLKPVWIWANAKSHTSCCEKCDPRNDMHVHHGSSLSCSSDATRTLVGLRTLW